VIQKIGLCICLYDLLSASEGLIGHGTGLVNVNGTAAEIFISSLGVRRDDDLALDLIEAKRRDVALMLNIS